jgi:tetratricopeptide (TPR) repeat protein
MQWTEQALDIAEALQLPEMLVRGWLAKGGIISPHRPEEARGLYGLALDTALGHELPLVATTYASVSDLGFQWDRYADSLSTLEQLLDIARRSGSRRQEWFALSEMTFALAMLGRWQEALDRLGEIPDEVIGRVTTLSSPLSGVVDVYLHRGQLDEARRLLSRYEGLGNSIDVQEEAAYHAAAAGVRLAEGKPGDALAAAERAVGRGRSMGIMAQDVKVGYLRSLEAASVLGDSRKLDELLTVVEQLPVGLRPPLLGAATHRYRAHMAGDDPSADASFTKAAAQLRALELPFHLAVVLLEHGEWLVAQARSDDAEPFLAEARETFERLEATPWLQRLDGVRGEAPSGIPA